MSKGKHRKPKDHTTSKRVATFSAAAVSVPTLGLTFTPHAMAADTQNIPRVIADDEPAAETPAVCDDYIVNRGDTLAYVARRYGVDLTTLEGLNPGIIAGDRPDDYSLIFRGGHIHLPDGKCSPVAAPPHERPSPHHHWSHDHGVWYKDCDAAPPGLHRGQAGYRHSLDMDGDGKACEGPWPPAPPVVTPPVDTPTDPGTGGDDSGSQTPPSDPAPSGFTPVIAPDAPGTPSGYSSNHTPEFWRPLVEQAEGIVPLTGGNQTDAIINRILIESSGNPNAINLWDSNAAKGDPSRGLMQTIGATFNAYHVAGTSTNIYDPLANICAALNYINDVYGGIVPSSSTY
jgi:hypothetical protein